jgi:hypothetical protein
MAKGDVLVSPWNCEFTDYAGAKITIRVDFDNATRAITGGLCHRDPDCVYHRIVWDNPSGPNRKQLPDLPDGDTTFTAQQVRSATGFRTIEDVLAVQITAEP